MGAVSSEKSASSIAWAIFSEKPEVIKYVLKKAEMEMNYHFLLADDFNRMLKERAPLAVDVARSHVFFGNVQGLTQTLWRFYKNEL